jgi:hypothetical protein
MQTSAALLLLAALLPPGDTPPRKKFIELGWDIVDTAYLRAHHAEMEKSFPFDGAMIRVTGKTADGKPANSEWGWDGTPWDRASFQAAIDDLRACRFTKFTDNFVRLNGSPGKTEWADDAAWKALSEKAAILAWVCKAGGLKGISLDPESYGENLFQFKPGGGRSFPETAALARKRGAQAMRAIASEHPSMTFLSLWLASLCMHAGRTAVPDDILIADRYGLWPSFLNGLLDAVPPSMTLVDANENGYYIEGDAYHRVASDMRSLTGPAFALIAPENRAKYRAQMQVGFGFYLDMYVNPEGNQYYRGPKEGGTRLDRLRDNLAAARDASDQYVWLYGEQSRWWGKLDEGRLKDTVGKGRLWEETLPGLTRTIAAVRDPAGAAREEVAQAKARGTLANLARNADCAKKSGNLPAEFGTWQDESSKGQFAWDPEGGGSARLTGVSNGCYIQKVKVRPGETYFAEASTRTQGTAIPTLTVRWQREDGQWTRWDLDVTLTFGPPGAGGWRAAGGAATVPDGVGFLVLLPGSRCLSGESACWFDNFGIYKLGGP